MNRLIVVSNRVPFAQGIRRGRSRDRLSRAAGGLVSVVEKVLRERGGTWIGWPGIAGKIPKEPLAKATRNAGYRVVPVTLSGSERDEFYYGYSDGGLHRPPFHIFRLLQNRAGILGG